MWPQSPHLVQPPARTRWSAAAKARRRGRARSSRYRPRRSGSAAGTAVVTGDAEVAAGRLSVATIGVVSASLAKTSPAPEATATGRLGSPDRLPDLCQPQSALTQPRARQALCCRLPPAPLPRSATRRSRQPPGLSRRFRPPRRSGLEEAGGRARSAKAPPPTGVYPVARAGPPARNSSGYSQHKTSDTPGYGQVLTKDQEAKKAIFRQSGNRRAGLLAWKCRRERIFRESRAAGLPDRPAQPTTASASISTS